MDAFLCSCSAYLLWVDAIAKLQLRICWSRVFMQVMFTRWERVLCTGAASETCLLVSIRPLVAGTLSLCRKPVARCLVCCPRSPAVAARGWTTSDDSSLPSSTGIVCFFRGSTGIVSGATFICCSLIREVVMCAHKTATIRPWQKGPSRAQASGPRDRPTPWTKMNYLT